MSAPSVLRKWRTATDLSIAMSGTGQVHHNEPANLMIGFKIWKRAVPMRVPQ